MEPVRRAVIPIAFEVLEEVLALQSGALRIVEILPKHPLTFGSRLCEIVVEGPFCPLVHEGEQYQVRQLIVHDLPDGSRQVELG